MYPMDYWYVIGESAEVAGNPLARTILDQPLVAYRTTSGEAMVLEAQQRNILLNRAAGS